MVRKFCAIFAMFFRRGSSMRVAQRLVHPDHYLVWQNRRATAVAIGDTRDGVPFYIDPMVPAVVVFMPANDQDECLMDSIAHAMALVNPAYWFRFVRVTSAGNSVPLVA